MAHAVAVGNSIAQKSPRAQEIRLALPPDHCSHKSGPNFFTENVAQNGLKSFFAQKVFRSAVRTPTYQIVPVSRVYPSPLPPPKTRYFVGMGVLEQEDPPKIQAPIKLAHPFLAPELRAEITDMRLLLMNSCERLQQ